ncbi:hypothetical protein, partial [Vibrio cholerae]|uniref:hypothetical protein n=1 Tax=Vibrio cholerae TaxID=666 RepID=UPI003F5D4D23
MFMYSVFTCRYWRYIMVRLIKHQQLLGEYCMNVSIEEFTHFDWRCCLNNLNLFQVLRSDP